MWKKSPIGILILSCSLLLADISSGSFVLAKEESLVIQEENESNTAKEGQECDNIKDVDEEAETPIQNSAEESEEEKELGNANKPAIEREEESEEEVQSNALDQLAEENKNALADDTYFIRSRLSNNKVIDINSTKGDEYVRLGTSNKKGTQKFKVVHDDKGYITFINEQSGLVLEANEKDTKVLLKSPRDSYAQKWIAKRQGEYCQIVSAKDENLVLDVQGGKAESGAYVQVSENTNSNSTLFHFISCVPRIESSQEVIKSGVYFIQSQSNRKYVLDIKSGSKDNKANVQLYKKNETIAQAFEFKYDNGYYTIKNLGSGKMLDVSGGEYMPGTNVWQYASNGSKAQKWKALVNEDGSYTFISVHNGMALDISGGKILSGSNIQVYMPNNSQAQRFQLEKADIFEEIVPSGDYYILAKSNSNYGLDIKGGSEASKANVQLYKANKSMAQAFQLKYADGSYTIRNLYSNKVLEAQGGKTTSGTNVWQYKKNGTEAQKWQLKKNKDGSYTFINKKSGKVLDVKNGKIVSGSNVQLYNSNGSKAQKFVLKEAEDCYQGVYYIQSAASTSKVVDVRGGSKSNKAYIQLYGNNSTEAQKWAVRRIGDVYSIISGKSGKALDVSGGNIKENTKIWQYNWNGTEAQQWKFVDLGDGYFKIVSAQNASLVLGISGGKLANKSDIVLQKWTNSKTQKWKLKKTTCKNKVAYLGFQEGSSFVIGKGGNSKLHVKEINTLGAGGVSWSSSDSGVLSVDSKGNISGKRSGSVTVTVKSKLDKNITANIKVYVSEERGELTKAKLDKLNLKGYDKLMIVAHPDDETFWGGGHLLEGNYLVVCITNGWNNTRRKEFQNAMAFSNEKAMILDYPDLSDGQKDNWEHCKKAIIQDLELLVGYKKWQQIVTHNPNGEYGHVHHQMLDQMVTKLSKEKGCFEELYYFGVFWKKNEIPNGIVSNLTPKTLVQKRKMTLKYTTQYKAYEKYWIWMEPYEYWIKATKWK